MAMVVVRVFLGGSGLWGDGEVVCNFGRGLDAGEETREESGKAFCEKVGSYPCFMAQIIAC